MNTVRRYAVLMACFVVTATARSRAESTPAASPASTWTLTPAVASQYMFRGVRLGGPSLQPALEFDSGGWGLGVWSSLPLANQVPGQSDPEIDPYGSYRFAVNDALSVQPGFTWYTYPRAERSGGFYPSTFEPNLAVNYTFAGITLTPKVYYDMVLDGATYELNAAYALPVRSIGTEIDFAANAGTYEWKAALAGRAPDVKGWGNYWLVGVTVPYQITRTSRVALGFAYARGSGNYFKPGVAPKTANAAAVGRGVVTLSYGVTL